VEVIASNVSIDCNESVRCWEFNAVRRRFTGKTGPLAYLQSEARQLFTA